VGNDGRVDAEPNPLHGLDHSAALALPANKSYTTKVAAP
jgi:hypothetical protein